MTLEPPPLMELEFDNFVLQYNSDLDTISDEMLDFLRENGVDEEWLISIMHGLYICNSD